MHTAIALSFFAHLHLHVRFSAGHFMLTRYLLAPHKYTHTHTRSQSNWSLITFHNAIPTIHRQVYAERQAEISARIDLNQSRATLSILTQCDFLIELGIFSLHIDWSFMSLFRPPCSASIKLNDRTPVNSKSLRHIIRSRARHIMTPTVDSSYLHFNYERNWSVCVCVWVLEHMNVSLPTLLWNRMS